MTALVKEPLLFISIGGMGLVQAILGAWMAFGGHLSVEQVTAINALATVILTVLARMLVVPTAQLPAGVAAQMADAKSARAADTAAKP